MCRRMAEKRPIPDPDIRTLYWFALCHDGYFDGCEVTEYIMGQCIRSHYEMEMYEAEMARLKAPLPYIIPFTNAGMAL